MRVIIIFTFLLLNKIKKKKNRKTEDVVFS